MENIIVRSYKTANAQIHGQGRNTYAVKTIIDDISKCSANFVEVDPGNFAYGYHFHENNEEVFYIIKGEASVKTESGDILLKEGDAICFPANQSGSHVISNPSKTEKLVYLDFGTANRPDVVRFTGTNMGMVVTKDSIINFKQ